MTRILTATIASLMAAPIAAQEVVGRDEATFTLAESVDRGGWVRIASPNGDIRITKGSGTQVQLQAEKVVRRGSIEDVGFVIRREAGGLTVCAVFVDADECDDDGRYRGRRRSRGWSRDHQVSVDFTVRIPAGVRVRASSGNGDVSVSGGGPEVVAASGNGRVDVSGATGEVRASSGNGRVTVDGAEGPVNASTGNGDIRITTLLGPVTASSGNGDIDVSMDRLTGSPDMRFSTGNGRIVVRVPEGFGAELESSTGSGRVTVDFPIQLRRGRINRSRVRGTIGSGGGRLVLSSGSGDLEIVRHR